MRAVVIDQGELHVIERSDPAPPAGWALVDVAAAGLNAADLLQRRGHYPAPAGWPADVPGMEFSGTVLAVGSASDEAYVGRRVCGIVGGGAQATRLVAPVAHLITLPDEVSLLDAGAFAEAFLTAHDALVTQARLSVGERLLVSGASGGVGNAAVQIARLRGAHVTAVTRHDAHAAALTALGAHEVISLDEVAGIDPVDVVLELVGAAHLGLAQRRLAPVARVVVIGVSGGGASVELNLLNVMSARASITGATLRARSEEEKARVTDAAARELLAPLAAGALKVPLAATFALDEVRAAYDYFAQPGKFGKVALTMAS